ncbi:MAG: helix-turn-helix domain-containing protein [Gorillibacterium sp.]|nr:helix-turn-helix domain-containing protein [Gorillibacterium sp.]
MLELGQTLKQARLDKGLTLEDLHETTKIRKRYLEAIEEGNFKLLPGNFYVRAFIKSYAEAVGLDPNEVLGLYKNVIPNFPAQEISSEPLRRKRQNTKVSLKGSSWITGLLLWAFFILIIVILYVVISNNYNGGNKFQTDKDITKITDKTPLPSLAASADVADTPTPTITPTPTPTPDVMVKLVDTKGTLDYYQVIGTSTMTVDLEIVGDQCWFSLETIETGSRKLVEQGTLSKGEKRTWDSVKTVYIKLGRANAAKVTVNGTDIPVGPNPSTKKFQIEFAEATAGSPLAKNP